MKNNQPYIIALRDAKRILQALEPACERIEIAGSIRRKAKTIGDIEYVAIPKPVLNLFGEPVDDETQIDWWLREHNGVSVLKDGPRYKQFYAHQGEEQGWPVDLFLAMPDNWGYIMMLRTGPWRFSKRMVTLRTHNGLRPPELQVNDGKVWRNGKPVSVPTEEDLFRLWGMDYILPEKRA